MLFKNDLKVLSEEKKNILILKHLKKLEPKEFHDLENRKQRLQSYKLPELSVDFLNSDHLTFEINDKYCKFIRFYSFVDVAENKWKGKRILSLVAEVDNYSTVDIIWYPTKKMVYAIDEAHETFTLFGSWDDFYHNIEKYIKSYLSGEII